MVELLKTAVPADETAQRAPGTLARTEVREGRKRPPLAARIGLAGLANIREGRLTVNLPDGRTLAFGTNGGLQAEVTVHRWRKT